MSQMHLMQTRRFLPLFITQFFGAFNDNLFKNAMVILILFKAKKVFGFDSSQMVVLAGGVFILPFFLFSATAGQLADKYEKSRLIRIIKLAEIAVMGIGALGFLLPSFELLIVTLFFMGAQSTIFGPIKYSILPQHLKDHEIVGGNALIEAGTFLAILLGTIAGGLLIVLDPAGPAVVSAGVLITAVLGYLASRYIPKADSLAGNLNIQWNPIAPTIDIIRFTRTNYNVFLAVMAISWFWFYGAAFLSLFPNYAKETLSADPHVVTLMLAVFSIGIGIGSLLCESMSRKRLELGLVPFGSIGMSIFAADLFFVGVPQFVAAAPGTTQTVSAFLMQYEGLRLLADLFGLAIFSGFFIVPLFAYIQMRSSQEHRSRIIAANNVLNSLFMVVASIALILFMNAGLTPPGIFLVLAVMNAAVAAYIYFFMPEFLLRFFAWGIASLMYRMRVRGHEHIPADGPAVLICNHVTFVDWLIIAAGVKRPLRFVMDHSFYKGFLARTLLKQAKVIPIASAKENPAILESAFERIAEELSAGEIVCIFPEGKITWDGELNPFRPGIERIIKTTPVPVIPMALKNLWGSYFSRSDGRAIKKLPKRFWSAIELEITAAIAPADVTAEKLQVVVKNMLA